MIAIAGAKGGCGKTVTTLGLAEAFARANTPALAIDGDRQLPNLHVVGDVDREPTLAALDSGTDIRSIAQPSPRSSSVGIVPAPKSSDHVDVPSLLERVQFDGVQLLLDCPSGAGPDVVEPLSAADGVIVVTTGDGRSLTAAETTIEMAERLDVPIVGTIVNECETVPGEVESWVDVPVLGVVPEREALLSDDAVQAAFDEIVDRLQTRNATSRTPPEYDDGRLPTGIDALDRRLGGGLAPGSVVALTAEPASQSEQFLYEATSARGTLYLTTYRSKRNVRRAIEAASVETGNPTIRHLSGEDRHEHAETMIGKLPNEATLVVDPVDALETTDRATYVSFLNALKDTMVETGGIAILHCLDDETTPDQRAITTHMADAVFDLETVTPGLGTEVEHYLSVPKFRTESSFSETVELTFEESEAVPVEPHAD